MRSDSLGIDTSPFPPILIRVRFTPTPTKALGWTVAILLPNRESRSSESSPSKARSWMDSIWLKFRLSETKDAKPFNASPGIWNDQGVSYTTTSCLIHNVKPVLVYFPKSRSIQVCFQDQRRRNCQWWQFRTCEPLNGVSQFYSKGTMEMWAFDCFSFSSTPAFVLFAVHSRKLHEESLSEHLRKENVVNSEGIDSLFRHTFTDNFQSFGNFIARAWLNEQSCGTAVRETWQVSTDSVPERRIRTDEQGEEHYFNKRMHDSLLVALGHCLVSVFQVDTLGEAKWYITN